MKYKLATTLLASLLLAAAAGSLGAQPPAGDCLIGPQLGATLLFPYFEVEAGDPNGQTTLISVNNGYSNPTLARVVLWSDWGNPVLAFDLYLGRFDIVTINLRDVLNGVIPSTGVGADFATFPFCEVLPPYHANPAFGEDARLQIAAMLTGQPDIASGSCWSDNHGDNRARGYITVDATRECGGVQPVNALYGPNDTAYPYFGDGFSTGMASFSNTLYGDVVYVDPSENLADGSEAVVLWADPSRFTAAPVFTFYGRFSSWDGRDRRVPLPSGWNMRFLNGGPFAGGASAIVYHDPEVATTGSAACGNRPAAFPLGGQVAAADEDGHFQDLPGSLPMSLATRKTSISELGLPFAAGLLQMSGNDSQMWVQPVLSANTRFSLGFNATPISFLCGISP